MENMIELNNVVKNFKIYDKPVDRLKEALSIRKTKYHKDFEALKGISFSIQKGDALGILGRNGSGKSTLLKLITGVLHPTIGDIQVHGKISAILELGTGFNPEYTGIENIRLNGMMMGYTADQIEQRMDRIIEFADIGDFINQPVKFYSSGMFARLAFAVSINVEPDILIIDEALAVGDTRFQIKCIDKLKEMKERGTTILFVSHASEQIKRFCNKAIWIKDGLIEAEGESSEIVDRYEDYMKMSSSQPNKPNITEVMAPDYAASDENDLLTPVDTSVLALIRKVELNNDQFKTFDKLTVDIQYEVYEQRIDDLLIGVAIYTPDREYIFGPNTYLEKVEIPTTRGKHRVSYHIDSLPLISGTFVIDVGIFNNEGIVCLDYKESVKKFQVTNKYFSEGRLYIHHTWEVNE
ncbi:ABC transporter ATP-binding protein [Paenibacillus sp. WLX2291]|uniref:ABC transporter ATP-binding protein n=1 Tax=Paenibacillus sp. WLX2291 TaxID=3296934 RepID=UPI0039844DBC